MNEFYLKRLKTIYLQSVFQVIINNQSRGVYTIQGQISDEILQYQ